MMTKPLLAILLLLPLSVSALEEQCDASHVRLDGASLVIDPTGFDDTQNIQCAVDSAIQQG